MKLLVLSGEKDGGIHLIPIHLSPREPALIYMHMDRACEAYRYEIS